MLQILTTISPMFLIIFVCAILKRTVNFGDKWEKVLNAYVYNIGFPVLIFKVLAETSFSFKSEFNLILVNTLIIFLGYILSIVVCKIFKLSKQMYPTLFICFVFSNITYIGVPILTEVYGNDILKTVSLVIAVYTFWIFTIGLGYLDYSLNNNKKGLAKNVFKKIIKNPLLISVVLGLIVGSLNISFPSVVDKSLKLVSGSVVPVVLVAIGLFIGTIKLGRIKDWVPVVIFTGYTLFIFPAIYFIVTKYFDLTHEQYSVTVLEAAMPLAITPFILADQYKLHKSFIAKSILLSTVLAILTIPFWIMLIGNN